MATFDTPEPITVTLSLAVGDVRITAGDRADTTVEVTPTDASSEADAKAVARTTVEYANGTLLVKMPKRTGWFGKAGSVQVVIGLPAGSQVGATLAMGDLYCTGRLGECRLRTSLGHVHLDRTGPLHVHTSGGEVSVEHVAGDAEITTGGGDVRVGAVDGTAVIKNSNGESWVGEVAGDLRLNAANGRISVDRTRAAVVVKAANGHIRIGEIARGSADMETACGNVEFGVPEGVSARLDVRTQAGRVRNLLTATDQPAPSDEKIEVRARTSFGDIVVRRP
ncbi:putative adhesin [Streptoalloteichus tenebrarius]|uniref:Adhesin n=1 Tax=Streptoalloteichus tenebrarius (strain ATCC 17920 / DSM 40477 / JCM 4838 / CBS 697.72 / NBRC 16177 / NCIMB 11028 / NRRL B-12390 / A12253. 1 / ISP 5477) TaxID=1933 RepID=A0ABT1HWG9_STRSD|nr:DUF4097 family beta strand repeat-containing protein [Streptoalloteichus tenebrarius]MCP2259855.1 putative adhesin [Streptoalloteichus tenebrarius]BFE99194.1 DUF4097 family beta strand repeat-containing protein [Streptoalloteichus tenebrarius]